MLLYSFPLGSFSFWWSSNDKNLRLVSAELCNKPNLGRMVSGASLTEKQCKSIRIIRILKYWEFQVGSSINESSKRFNCIWPKPADLYTLIRLDRAAIWCQLDPIKNWHIWPKRADLYGRMLDWVEWSQSAAKLIQ